MLASPFDYLFHTIAGYLLYFLKPLAFIGAIMPPPRQFAAPQKHSDIGGSCLPYLRGA
jgi:hypothetical protein